MITGIFRTEREESYYSDNVFYAGADTSIFYVVRGNVGIVETHYNASLRQIYPNPACSHFTVSNAENASLYLYNMLGQEVYSTQSTEENTIINVNYLPQGLYVLKVVKNRVASTHRVVVTN